VGSQRRRSATLGSRDWPTPRGLRRPAQQSVGRHGSLPPRRWLASQSGRPTTSRHEEREEKGEGPRENSRLANGALTVKSRGARPTVESDTQPRCVRQFGSSIRWRLRRGILSNGARPGGLWRPPGPPPGGERRKLLTGVAASERAFSSAATATEAPARGREKLPSPLKSPAKHARVLGCFGS